MNHSPMGQRSSRQIPDRSSASLTFNGHYHFGTLQPSQCSVPITPFFETAVVRTTKLSAPRRRVRLCTSMAGCTQPEDFKCPKMNDTSATLTNFYLSSFYFPFLVSSFRAEAEAGISEAEDSEAEVSEAEVSEAEVSEAEVSEADVSEAGVSEAEVSETEVSEADVSEAELSEAKVSEGSF